MAKSKPSKSSSKTIKKTANRAVRKQLEASFSDKFLEAVKSLGHDAEKISKDIKKAAKQVAKSAAERFKDIKQAVEHKFESDAPAPLPKARIKRAVKTVQQAEKRVEKAVAEVEVKIKKIARKAPAKIAAATEKIEAAVKKPRVARKPAATAGKVTQKRVRSTTKAPAAAPATDGEENKTES